MHISNNYLSIITQFKYVLSRKCFQRAERSISDIAAMLVIEDFYTVSALHNQ